MTNAAKAILALVLAVSLASAGCKNKPEPEGYRVVGFDRQTMQWTIIRNGTFDGKYLKKRLIAVCDLYQWGNHEMVTGPDACDLRVGELIVLNPFPPEGQRGKFVDIWEMGSERLFISKGDGLNKVNEQFIIKKYEVLPDN